MRGMVTPPAQLLLATPSDTYTTPTYTHIQKTQFDKVSTTTTTKDKSPVAIYVSRNRFFFPLFIALSLLTNMAVLSITQVHPLHRYLDLKTSIQDVVDQQHPVAAPHLAADTQALLVQYQYWCVHLHQPIPRLGQRQASNPTSNRLTACRMEASVGELRRLLPSLVGVCGSSSI